MKSLNFIFEHGGYEWGYKSVFLGFQNYCLNNINNINFNCINSVDRHNSLDYIGPYFPEGPMYCIIENPKNKKYILISYWDKLTDVIRLFDLENCVEIYSSAGGHVDDIMYKPINIKYTPISYIITQSHYENEIEYVYNNIKPNTVPDKLSFMGNLYLFRQYLLHDNRFDITDKKLPSDEYFKFARNNRINLSLNGAAELSQRDIEFLGIGNAVIRLQLSTKFHNDLIPDYHYVSVKFDDLYTDDINLFYNNLSNRILDRFNEVKNDIDYLEFVGNNGRQWYKENGTISANINILSKVIDFNKLF